jgi:hypothetical protein
MSLLNFLRPASLTAGLALLLSTAGAANAAVMYTFTATCGFGCTGVATGTVTLTDLYTPGNSVNLSEFTQLDFSSNNGSFTITAPSFIAGSLPALSGPANFDVSDGTREFASNVFGDWIANVSSSSIAGPGSGIQDATYSLVAAPEPSSIALIGAGLAGLAALRRRKQ